MATLRKLRGRWQAQVRRRDMKPRCKSFDTKIEAEKWARDIFKQNLIIPSASHLLTKKGH